MSDQQQFDSFIERLDKAKNDVLETKIELKLPDDATDCTADSREKKLKIMTFDYHVVLVREIECASLKRLFDDGIILPTSKRLKDQIESIEDDDEDMFSIVSDYSVKSSIGSKE